MVIYSARISENHSRFDVNDKLITLLIHLLWCWEKRIMKIMLLPSQKASRANTSLKSLNMHLCTYKNSLQWNNKGPHLVLNAIFHGSTNSILKCNEPLLAPASEQNPGFLATVQSVCYEYKCPIKNAYLVLVGPLFIEKRKGVMPAKHTDSCNCNNKCFKVWIKIHSPITVSGYTSSLGINLFLLCYLFHVRISHDKSPSWFHEDDGGGGGQHIDGKSR